MSDRRQPRGRGKNLSGALGHALALGLLAGVATAACDTSSEGREDARKGVQRVLDAQAEAVLAGDRKAYLAVVDPEAAAFRAKQRRQFANLNRLPFAEWSYDVTGLRVDEQRAEAEVRLRYRLDDYDRAPVTADERLEFRHRDGAWYLGGERPGSSRQLWEQGEVTVVRGEHSLVLSVGGKSARLREIAATADRAVPAVSDAWPRDWARRVVVEVPESTRRMGELLDAPADAYRGIAAVTTSRRASAGRVVINPQAYGVLSATGRQVVMTHETTHVAVRKQTSEATPLWLSEGFADWSGYRDTGRTPRQAAPELARAIAEGTAPRELPADEDYRFGGDTEALGRAYESGWLACRMIAGYWGEERLREFYRTVGEQDERTAEGVNDALLAVLGVTEEEFTERWRGYLREQLSGF